MYFFDFIKNANIGLAAAWIAGWNIICGVGIYYDGLGPIETISGAWAMAFAGLFSFSTTSFCLFTPRGRRLITASYSEFFRIQPFLRLLALASGLLFAIGVFNAISITSRHG